MHWISLIVFLMIINLYRSQPTEFQHFKTGNSNKDTSFHIGINGFNSDTSESKNNAENIIYTTTTTQTISSEMSTKAVRSVLKSVDSSSNSSDNNRCYFILPFLLSIVMMIIHF